MKTIVPAADIRSATGAPRVKPRCVRLPVMAIVLGLVAGLSADQTHAHNGPYWFVRTSGNDNHDGSTPAKAFRTIGKAASKVRPGHTVIIGGGTYDEAILMSPAGTSSQNIIFMHDDKNQTGDGSNVQIRQMLLDRAQWTRLIGLSFHSANGASLYWDYSKNCRMDNCRVTGGAVGMKVRASKLLLSECQITDCVREGIWCNGAEELALVNGCVVRNCQRAGIVVHGPGSSVVIEASEVSSNHKSGIEIDDGNSVSANRSKFTRNGESGLEAENSALSLVNCAVTNNNDEGVKVEGGSSTSFSMDHCTVAFNSDDGIDHDDSSGTCTIGNCIIAFNNDEGLDFNNTRRVWHGNNLLYGNRKGNYSHTSPGSGEIQADPQFVANDNLRLQAGSPAIDTVTSPHKVDLAGNIRPIGAANDMGCYEGGVVNYKTYYVSTTGNDANTGLAPNQAFRTIHKAGGVVSPGDRVYVAAGTYTEQPVLQRAGSADKPIQFIAQGAVIVQPTTAGNWTMQLHNAHYLSFTGFRFSANNFRSAGTYAHGVYAYRSNYVTFKECEFDNSYYALHGYEAGLIVDKCNFHDIQAHGTLTYYGGIEIKDSRFDTVAYGPWSYRDDAFAMTNTTVTNTQSWGLGISMSGDGSLTPFGTKQPVLTNCTFDKLGHGVYVYYPSNSDRITLTGTKFTNIGQWEMQLTYGELTITPAWRAAWGLPKAANGLITYQGKFVLDGVTFDDYTNGWGYLDYYSDLTLRNVAARRNYHGVQIYAPTKLTASDCSFDDNKYWGFLLYNHADKAKSKLTKCAMRRNAYGAYFYRSTDSNLQLEDVQITDNSSHGLYLQECEAEFSPRTMGTRWNLSNNGYAITTWSGKALFDRVTLSGSKSWAVLTYYGDVTVRDSTFSGNGNGFYSYFNRTFDASGCAFNKNPGHGLAYFSNGTYYGLDRDSWKWQPTPSAGHVANCTMDENGYGLYLAYCKPRSIQIESSPIRNNTVAGLYADQSEFDFTPSTMASMFQISGNAAHIYAGYGKYTFKDLTLNDAKSYGVATWYSDVTVKHCTFKNSGYTGFQAYRNKSLFVSDSTFDENTSWGMLVYGGTYYGNVNGTWGWYPAEHHAIKNCTFNRNRSHGLYLDGIKQAQATLGDLSVCDNGGHGLYAVSCELDFTSQTMGRVWKISGNTYGITTYYGKHAYRDITLADNKGWGLLSYYSATLIDNCDFTRNPSGGVHSYYDKSFKAHKSRFYANGSWGAAYYGNGTYYGLNPAGQWAWLPDAEPGEFVDCVIEKQTSHGLYLGATTDRNIRLVNTPIRDNAYHGLYASQCDLIFDKTTLGTKWNITNNGYGITLWSGRALFDGVEVADNKYWGVLSYYADVTVKNCTLTRNPHGGWHSYFDKSFIAQNTRFDKNGSWGLQVYNNGTYYGIQDGAWKWLPTPGPSSLTDCSISENSNGLYFIYGSENSLRLSNTPISKNTGHGLYANQCNLAFTPETMGRQWQIKDNGYGVTLWSGKGVFRDVAVTDNKYWGVLSYYADVALENCSFARNASGGYHSYYDKSFVANKCQFAENGSWGLYCYANGTYYGLKDGTWAWQTDAAPAKLAGCTFAKNTSHGVGFNGINEDRIVMSDCVAEDNGSIGIYFANSTVTLSPDTSGKWVSRNNGHGFHASSSNVTVTDFEITGNREWGMYTYYSNVTMKNARFNGNGHGMYWYTAPWDHGFVHKLTVEDSVFENATGHHGLLTYYGPVTIKNSIFRNNKGDGLYTCYNKSVAAENCQFTGNGRWGVVYHVNYLQTNDWSPKELFKDNVQTLTSCQIDRNAYGLYIYNAANPNFGLKATDITRNANYSIYYNACNLVVDDQQSNDWSLANNGYGPAMSGGEIAFKNVVNQNSREHGFVNWYGKLTMEGCTSSGSLYGLYQYRPSAPSTVVNCRFDGRNDAWGWGLLSYGGGVSVRNSVVNGFYNGSYTYTYGDEATVPVHVLDNNTFANLLCYGIYLPNGTATARNNVLAGPTTSGKSANGYGLLDVPGGGKLAHSHNLIHGFSQDFYRTSDPNETTVLNHPRFVNLTTGDLHLAQGSPAINSGLDLSAVFDTDLEGNRRPSYKVFEIGAYEYTNPSGSVRVLSWGERK